MLQIQKRKMDSMPAHHEVRVRTLNGKFPANSYLVKYDTNAGKTIEVIGKIVRGGKPLGQFKRKEYPNAACEYPDWSRPTFGHMDGNGLLFVYYEVQPAVQEKLLGEMNRKGTHFYFPLHG
ncbi:MAG: hypothetical protein WCT52_04015 [Candidatus Micrarchaeia archaeon]